MSNFQYVRGKRDMARAVLEKIEKGYGMNDIKDLVESWTKRGDLKVRCKKNVLMDFTNIVAFTEGQVYHAWSNGYYIDAIDNQKEEHGIGVKGDEFFEEHFEIVK